MGLFAVACEYATAVCLLRSGLGILPRSAVSLLLLQYVPICAITSDLAALKRNKKILSLFAFKIISF